MSLSFPLPLELLVNPHPTLEDLRVQFLNFVDKLFPEDRVIYCQKLQFLDEFYDVKKRRARQFPNHHQLYHTCNNFIENMFKAKEGLMLSNRNQFSFLLQLEEIENEFADMMPLIVKHEHMRSWLRLKAEEANHMGGCQTTDSVDSALDVEDYGLENLMAMIAMEIKDLLYYFQCKEEKYCHSWMTNNQSKLPNHIIDAIQTRKEINDKFLYKEEEMTHPVILDKDFQFMQYLCEHNTNWKMSKLFNYSTHNVYKSQGHIFTGSRQMKYVYRVDLSLENLVKGVMNKDLENDAAVLSCQFKDYSEIDVANSSKKYACVRGSLTAEISKFLRLPTTNIVISTKAKYHNKELVEVILIYKSCEKGQMPVFGGMLFRKEDKNKTSITNIFLVTWPSLLQSDIIVDRFAMKIMVKKMWESIKKAMEDGEKNGYPTPNAEQRPLWRSFSEYCMSHYGIDASTL